MQDAQALQRFGKGARAIGGHALKPRGDIRLPLAQRLFAVAPREVQHCVDGHAHAIAIFAVLQARALGDQPFL